MQYMRSECKFQGCFLISIILNKIDGPTIHLLNENKNIPTIAVSSTQLSTLEVHNSQSPVRQYDCRNYKFVLTTKLV